MKIISKEKKIEMVIDDSYVQFAFEQDGGVFLQEIIKKINEFEEKYCMDKSSPQRLHE